MKRAADITLDQPSRHTRSVARREQADESAVERQHERAIVLMSMPLLQALPAVLSSGFLYQYDCLSAAATCQNWFFAWKEVEDSLPSTAKVEIFVSDISTASRNSHPVFLEENGLEETIGSSEFTRQVFDKVNALRVAAKPSEAARARAEAALPVWGIDIQVAILSVWGPNSHNNGGIYFDLGKKKDISFRDSGTPWFPGRTPWQCRLDSKLVLWTGIRNWRVYDGQPLWP